MGKRYRIRVSGKPRKNPDPAMLAQIVILIGRRLQQERLQQSQPNDRGAEDRLSDTQQPAPDVSPESESGQSNDDVD